MGTIRRQTARLRWARVSIPGARYFLKVCTQNRTPVFSLREHASRSVETLFALHDADDIELLAATVMPDHVHMVFVLGSRLTVGQVMAKFKTLARGGDAWRWQQDGFEHRLRANEAAEDYGFYVFMNPYRARLAPIAQPWPWWTCPDTEQFGFTQKLDRNGIPPEEWLDQVEETNSRIATGE